MKKLIIILCILCSSLVKAQTDQSAPDVIFFDDFDNNTNNCLFYQMPFTPFFGNLIGFGAGRNVTLAVDYLKVIYL